jgi:hypothetical protein
MAIALANISVRELVRRAQDTDRCIHLGERFHRPALLRRYLGSPGRCDGRGILIDSNTFQIKSFELGKPRSTTVVWGTHIVTHTVGRTLFTACDDWRSGGGWIIFYGCGAFCS